MIRRSTWVVLAIFSGFIIVATIVFRRKPIQSVTITQTTSANNLVRYPSVEIVLLRIEKGMDEYIELAREEDDGWILLNPEGEMDTTVLENAVTQFANVRILSELKPAPPQNATGMDNPAYVIQVSYNNGDKETFRVGIKTQTGSGYYVSTSEDQVFIVSPSGIDSLASIIEIPAVHSEGN